MNSVFEVLRCPHCDATLPMSGERVVCRCGSCVFEKQASIYRDTRLRNTGNSEMEARDLQAGGYLHHSKFPTQIAAFTAWLRDVTDPVKDPRLQQQSPVAGKLALDLGCGPGPYTCMLQEAGFNVLAVDISAVSLEINARICHQAKNSGAAIFIQADLNDLFLERYSVDLLVMADFLQHLGSRARRERLLQQAFAALRPGGRFCISFFNLNIKNFFKGDIHGDFAGGKIPYERLSVSNVLGSFPGDIVVEQVTPMNIFHGAALDALAAALPGAFCLARMAFVSGRKIVKTVAGPEDHK